MVKNDQDYVQNLV